MTERREGAVIPVPGFQEGGRVERTGIALVHEGEYIYPAPGSEAVVTPAERATEEGQALTFHFPIEVEIIGELSEMHMEAVAGYVYEQLHTALQAQGQAQV
jgi:hypothetical protein